MRKEKQIEEMAKDLCDIECKGMKCGICDSYGCEYRMQAEALYNAGYRKQEWISVDERLPETKLTKVTIASQDIASGKTMETEERTMNTSELVVVVYKAHLDGKFSMFVGLDQLVDGRWFYTDSVTHWMPLPEAPKMKGGAEI